MLGQEATGQMSKSDLIAWVRRVSPGPESYELSESEFVLPMTVTEAWSYFFAKLGQYNFDKALKELGEKFYEPVQDWTTQPDMLYENHKVLKHRVVTSESPLPKGNAYSSHIKQVRNSYLMFQNETMFIVED